MNCDEDTLMVVFTHLVALYQADILDHLWHYCIMLKIQ